jgi:integrase/recombinase XerD
LTRAPKIQQAPISGSKVIKRRDFDRLLEAATARDRLLLRFLWVTGCRVSELTGARLDAIKAEGEIAFIRIIGKGSKERTLRIKISLLEEIRAEFKGSTFLFETAFRTDKDGKTTGGRPFSRVYVSTRVHDLCRRVLNRSLGSHSLRHSFATRKILAGKAVKAVSVYLGHSSTSITQDMYVSAELSDADLLGDDED